MPLVVGSCVDVSVGLLIVEVFLMLVADAVGGLGDLVVVVTVLLMLIVEV